MTTSNQIRTLLASRVCEHMTHDEWTRLDDVMKSQREKYGDAATAWWFDVQRGVWWLRSQQCDQSGSVGR